MKVTRHEPVPPPVAFTLELSQEEAQALFTALNWSSILRRDENSRTSYTQGMEGHNARLWHALNDAGLEINYL